MFELDRLLAADTKDVGMLKLSRVLLMRDARYPWLILVPQQAGLIELGDLDRGDRVHLMDEIEAASGSLVNLYKPEKINTGALGNIVRQLHIHIVARNTGDPAWPGPVWGHSAALPYADDALDVRIVEIRKALNISAD